MGLGDGSGIPHQAVAGAPPVTRDGGAFGYVAAEDPLILFVGGLPVTAGHGAGVLKTPMPTAYAVQGHAEPHEPNERHPARKPAPGVLEGRPGQRAVLASASEAFPPPCVVRRKAVTLRACGPA